MKQMIFLIFLTITLLNAKSITLSDEDVKNINSNYFKKAIYLRLKGYIQLKKKIKDFPTIKKLNYVNSFYNKILPINDETKYKVDDHWATPKEFLIVGRGDCEDYAIAKYFTLIESGISKENLFLSIVKVKGATNYHMVLLYFDDLKNTPFVLDNLSFRVLPFDKRTDLEPKVIFNEETSYILKDKKIFKKVKIKWEKENKWEELLYRVYDKNE